MSRGKPKQAQATAATPTSPALQLIPSAAPVGVEAKTQQSGIRGAVITNPLFNVLLWIVTGLCGATFVAMIALAIFVPNPATPTQDRVLAICEHAFTSTLGAIIGLFCGRAAAPDKIEPPPHP